MYHSIDFTALLEVKELFELQRDFQEFDIINEILGIPWRIPPQDSPISVS